MWRDPGDLRELVTIQQKVEQLTGGRGQPRYTWQAFAQVYASFERYDGEKLTIGPTQFAVGDMLMRTRWVSGVTEEMQVVDSEGQIYSIKAVLRDDGVDRYFWMGLHLRLQRAGI